MRPGDTFGVMLVPNGTVQQVFATLVLKGQPVRCSHCRQVTLMMPSMWDRLPMSQGMAIPL
jgi:hypothetical protein